MPFATDAERRAADHLVAALAQFVHVHQTTLAERLGTTVSATAVPVGTPHGPAIPEPLVVDAKGAAALLCVSRATFFKMHSAGRVPLPVRLTPRCPRWVVAELTAWMSAGCPSRAAWLARKADRR